jgi:hypothetical protein
MLMDRAGHDSDERRARRRYPVELALRFLTRAGNALTVAGEGTSINMSSTGMLFRSPKQLESGERVIAAVQWPTMPGGRKPVLLVEGTVVWANGLRVGMTVSHYRFLPDEIQPVSAPEHLQFEVPKSLTPTRVGRSAY